MTSLKRPSWRLVALVLLGHTVYLYVMIFGENRNILDNKKLTTVLISKRNVSTKYDRGERYINMMPLDYDKELNRKWSLLVDRKAQPRDPEMISFVRDLIDPPSQLALRNTRKVTETPQSKAIDSALQKKVCGYIITICVYCLLITHKT